MNFFKPTTEPSHQTEDPREHSPHHLESPKNDSGQSDSEEETIRPSSKPPHIHAIGGFRFIAALAVMVGHFRGRLNFAEFHPAFGGRGVSFFFVLSGFILTYVYSQRLTKKGVLSFYFKRIIRLWPLHLVCLVISIWLLGHGIRVAKFAVTVLLLQSWIPDSKWVFAYNGIAWSISTEMFFFFAFPFLLLGGRRQFWIKFGVIAGLTLGAMYVIEYLRYDSDVLSHVDWQRVVHANPLLRLVEFCLGMATAFLFLSSIERQRASNNSTKNLSRHLTQPSRGTRRMLLDTLKELAAISTLGLFILTYDQVRDVLVTSEWAGRMFSLWYHFSGSSLAFAIIIYVFASSKGILARLMGTKLMNYLGEISYAFFLIHFTIIAYHNGVDWSASNPNRWLVASSLLAMVLGLAILLHHVVEKPVRDGLMSFSKRGIGLSILDLMKQLLQFGFSISGAACLLLCLAGWLGVRSQYTPLNLTPAMYETIFASSREVREIQFAETIRVMGCDTKATKDGIELHFVWQKSKPTKHYRFTHLIDSRGEIAKVLPPDKTLFREAQLIQPFSEVYLVSNEFLDDAAQIGIGFYCPEVDPVTNKPLGTLARSRCLPKGKNGRLIVVNGDELRKLKKEIERIRSAEQ